MFKQDWFKTGFKIAVRTGLLTGFVIIICKKWCSDIYPKGYFEDQTTGKGSVRNHIIKVCKKWWE